MMKRIIALLLVIMLTAALAMPASALSRYCQNEVDVLTLQQMGKINVMLRELSDELGFEVRISCHRRNPWEPETEESMVKVEQPFEEGVLLIVNTYYDSGCKLKLYGTCCDDLSFKDEEKLIDAYNRGCKNGGYYQGFVDFIEECRVCVPRARQRVQRIDAVFDFLSVIVFNMHIILPVTAGIIAGCTTLAKHTRRHALKKRRFKVSLYYKGE